MLHQIHWQYRDRKETEFIAQREVNTDEEMREFVDDTLDSIERPEGAILMICNEDAPEFVKEVDQDVIRSIDNKQKSAYNHGFFYIDIRLVINSPETVQEVLNRIKFIPYHVNSRSTDKYQLKMIGKSPMFERLDEVGAKIPEYELIITNDDQGNIANIELKRK